MVAALPHGNHAASTKAEIGKCKPRLHSKNFILNQNWNGQISFSIRTGTDKFHSESELERI